MLLRFIRTALWPLHNQQPPDAKQISQDEHRHEAINYDWQYGEIVPIARKDL